MGDIKDNTKEKQPEDRIKTQSTEESDEALRTLRIRANYYIIRCVWHVVKGARPRNFNLYDKLGIDNRKYDYIIKSGRVNFPDVKYFSLHSITKLPVQVFQGYELIDAGISDEEWETYFVEYDKNVRAEASSIIELNDKYTNAIALKVSADNISGYLKVLVDYFNDAEITGYITPNEYMKRLVVYLAGITVFDLELCDVDVLKKTIDMMDNKIGLMKAVKLCKEEKKVKK